MKCNNHFPIIGKWKVIERTKDYTVFKCPRCGEIYQGRRRKGRIIKFRIRKQAREFEREITQPYLDAEKPNPKFADYYKDDQNVNLREFYSDKEVKKMVGKKYIETHELKQPFKKDHDNLNLKKETVKI